MPLELGVFRRKKYGGVKHRNKSCIILHRAQYRFQRYISDIAGQDIHSHGGEIEELATRVAAINCALVHDFAMKTDIRIDPIEKRALDEMTKNS